VDALIAKVRDRASALGQRIEPVATATELDEAERRLGFALPSFHRRLLLEVGNGGFGPGCFYGMPPHGYVDDDLRDRDVRNIVDLYLQERADAEHPAPRGLIFLANWGGGKWSHLDCTDDAGRVVTSEWLERHDDGPEGLYYWETSPRLAAWLQEWTESDGRWPDLTVDVLGWETRKSPFTGLPREYPITRPRGPAIDLSDRI